MLPDLRAILDVLQTPVPMDVYLSTLGCRLNEAELASWSRALRDGGHRVVTTPERAQVMVLNSCAVTAEAARKSRQLIHRAHRANPAARLVVTGCYAELEPERVAEIAGVDLVVGNADKDALVDRLERELDLTTMPALARDGGGDHMFRAERTRAFVKVQDGCRNRCTFCIVTVARGEERSRGIHAIVDEVRALAAAGHREVVLTGVHLGGYGSDLGVDLFELVRAVLRDTDIPRVRLSSLEPWELPAHFFELWDDPRLMPHLHLPLQSGCDAVLRRMARRNTAASFEDLVTRARAAIPELTVTTDLIVGFPGETDDEHRRSVELVRRIGFGHIHIFAFSARAGTTAARMRDPVPREVKRARSEEVHELAAAMKTAHLARYVGTERPVLWESGNAGYTDNYLRVVTSEPPAGAIDNVLAPARILASTGEHLIAPPPPSAAAPRRVRLTVVG